MWRLALALVALAALAFTLRDLDVPATLALVRGLGPSVALVLVPYGVATTPLASATNVYDSEYAATTPSA